MSLTEGQTCFREALDNIDFTGAHVGEMSNAWTTGEVKALTRVAASAPARTCLEGGSAVSNFKTHSEDDSFSRIKVAMLSTKRSVVILPIGMLTGDGNLINRLRQEGFAVQLPRALH